MEENTPEIKLESLLTAPVIRHMDTEAVKAAIPHRYPFLLVDRVDIIEEKKYGVGTKCVTATENYFQGHFPSRSVMPGMLILESLAQTAAAMAMSLPEYSSKLAFFMSVEEAKFRQPVTPGDVLKNAVHVMRLSGRAGKVRACAFVDGKVAVEATMSFAFAEK